MIKLILFILFVLPNLALANTQPSAQNVTVSTSSFINCLTSSTTNVQMALNQIDVCLGNTSGYTFSDSITKTGSTVTLVNDVTSPGNSYYYGTNSSGTKGFFAISGSIGYPGSGIVVSTGSAWGASINGTGAQFVKGNGSLDGNTYITSNQNITMSGDLSGSGTTSIPVTLNTVNSNVGSYTNANITVNAKGLITAASNGSGSVTSIATTSPITGGTITSTGTIGITQATTSTNGYLSSTDWNTFNGKQAALSTNAGSSHQFFTAFTSPNTFTLAQPAQADITGLTTGSSPSFTGLTLSGLTASQILATDGSSNVQSLAVATYPSLTELSYVKGVTSAIQTQINGKVSSQWTLSSTNLYAPTADTVTVGVASTTLDTFTVHTGATAGGQTINAVAVGQGGIDANTIAGSHLDGANGATTATDFVGTYAITMNTNALSTAWSAFGTASILGSTSYPAYSSYPSGLGAIFTGTGAFTVAVDVYLTSVSNESSFWGFYNSGTNNLGFYFDNSSNLLTFNDFNGSSVIKFTCPWTPSTSTKYNLEVDRISNGNTAAAWAVYINGVAQTLTLVSGAWNATIQSVSGTVQFAGVNGISVLYGYEDELQFSNIARHTSNFTPPLAAYDNLSPYGLPTLTFDTNSSLLGYIQNSRQFNTMSFYENGVLGFKLDGSGLPYFPALSSNGILTTSGGTGLTGVTAILPVANGGTNASSASITAFNNITGYTAAGATGTTSTNLVFSTSPTLVTPILGAATATTINIGAYSGTALTTNPVIVAGISPFQVEIHGNSTNTYRAAILFSGYYGSSSQKVFEIGTDAEGNGTNDFYWYDDITSNTVFKAMGTGQLLIPTAASASTPMLSVTGALYTGGTATSTQPIIYWNKGSAPSTWSTNGTVYGANSATGFTGNFVDYHVNGGSSVFSVNYQGLIGNYNSISTVSNGVPSELGTVDLTAQAASISATTLYTPSASGTFRISASVQVTQAASTSSILGGTTGIVITYTEPDGSVAQSVTIPVSNAAGGKVTIASGDTGNTTATNDNGIIIIRAKTGVAIQYAIGYTSVGATAMNYALHLKCEAL